jgi:serine/threonine-protein kinase
MNTDRNLLFAVLALQADLLDRERFVLACTLWASRKTTPIADLLIEQGWLTPAGKDVVDQLIDLKLKKHGGDVQASLAEAAGAGVRGALASIADIDVERSLAALSPHASGVVEVSTGLPADGAGRNLLFEEIGCGGMGRVLRGRDPDLGRDLAVKVLREDRRNEAGMERRFVEEAQIGGQMQHPGIVPVYELGRFPDQLPYFTMKLVKGRTLAEVLKDRSDPEQDRARLLTIFEAICQTMAYAHSKRVIHRDLKPSNIMLGAFGEVQVMDWGLAKVLGHNNGDPEATVAGSVIRTARSGLTTGEDGRTGVVGTPAYMAPEQARGGVETVDERADVFGLGAILCVILTGQPPYAGPDKTEVVRQAATGDLTHAFSRLDGCAADAELVALCKACLAPQPQDRPRDAGEVATRIAAYQAAVQERLHKAELDRAAAQARAEEAKATAMAERKAKRRTRALAAAVFAVVAVAAAGGLLVQHQAAEHEAEQARRDTEQQQTVEFALEKAKVLRDQARLGEAAAVLEQARRVLANAGPDDLRQRLELAEAELTLVNHLEGIRQRRASTIVDGKFDTRTAERDYRDAFRDAGLGNAEKDDVAVVAARVGASGVAGALLAALDDWASVAQRPASKSWLLAVAHRANSDPWANRFRDLAVWQNRLALQKPAGEAQRKETAKLRQAVQALAEDALRDNGARLHELSPQALVSFGALLGDAPEAVPLLSAAQRLYPNDFWLNLRLAAALGNAGQRDGAVAYNRVAVALRPDAVAAHNNLGIALLYNQDVEGAITEFRTAIDLNPKEAMPHANLGNALREKGDIEGALTACRTATALAPKYAYGHAMLCWALSGKGDFDAAIAAGREAIRLDAKNAGAHANVALALQGKGDIDAAIVEYRNAVALAPNYFRARVALANALQEKNDWDGATAEWRKAVDIDPKDAASLIGLGWALYKKGEVDAALDTSRKAISLYPKLAAPHNIIAHSLQYGKKDLAGAVAEFNKALELNPKWKDVHFSLGLAQLQQGRFVAAARSYGEGFADDPKYTVGWHAHQLYNAATSAARAAAGEGEDAKDLPEEARPTLRRQALAWLRDDLARYVKTADRDGPAGKKLVSERLRHWQQDAAIASVRDEAALASLPDDQRQAWRQFWQEVAALQTKVGEQKDNAATQSQLGHSLLARGDLEGATAAFRKAIDLDPGHAEAHNGLGRALQRKGNLDEAIAEYRKATDLDPKSFWPHHNLGHALHAKGENDGALAAFRKAIGIDAKIAGTHAGLGWVLHAQGDRNGAVTAFRKAVDLDPKSAVSHSDLGCALQAKGDLDGAIAEQRTAMGLDPKLAAAHSRLGGALHGKGDLDGAIAACRRAIDLDPKLADPHATIGLILQFGKKDLAGAVAELRKALELNPKWNDVHFNLGLAQLQQRHFAAAARSYADGFAGDPKVAVAWHAAHRYHAATSAAQAAAGQGDDAKDLPREVRMTLRRRALGWLRDDLSQYAKMADREGPSGKKRVREHLMHWRHDTALASVRDQAALAELPDDERRAWRQLWQEVDALLDKAHE